MNRGQTPFIHYNVLFAWAVSAGRDLHKVKSLPAAWIRGWWHFTTVQVEIIPYRLLDIDKSTCRYWQIDFTFWAKRNVRFHET